MELEIHPKCRRGLYRDALAGTGGGSGRVGAARADAVHPQHQLGPFAQDRTTGQTQREARAAPVHGPGTRNPRPFTSNVPFTEDDRVSPFLFTGAAFADGVHEQRHVAVVAERPLERVVLQRTARHLDGGRGGALFLALLVLEKPLLYGIVCVLGAVEQEVHDGFRLWITTEVHARFPMNLLQASVKFTNEPPQGIRASLKRTFADMTQVANSASPDWLVAPDWSSAGWWPIRGPCSGTMSALIGQRLGGGQSGFRIVHGTSPDWV